MKLSERLSQLREEKGLNQKEAAAALGIQYPTYNKYETGGSKPTYESLIEIAIFYGCTTDYLLGVSSAAAPEHSDIAARTGLNGGNTMISDYSNTYTLKSDATSTATITTEEYAYLVECRTRLDILKEIRRKEINNTSNVVKPYLTDTDIVLGDEIRYCIEDLNRD